MTSFFCSLSLSEDLSIDIPADFAGILESIGVTLGSFSGVIVRIGIAKFSLSVVHEEGRMFKSLE